MCERFIAGIANLPPEQTTVSRAVKKYQVREFVPKVPGAVMAANRNIA